MNEEIEFDPAARALCPDGACVGLIGADGRCGECGRAGDPATGASLTASATNVDDARASDPVATDSGDGFDAGRKLCDDGACVGVVGPRGTCEICGRKSGH